MNQKFIDKFTKLRFRISFKARESHSSGELEVINDMKWVKRKIEDWEAGRVPDRIDLGTANRLWKEYSADNIIGGLQPQQKWRYTTDKAQASLRWWVASG